MSSCRVATVTLPSLNATSSSPIIVTHISDTHNKNNYQLPSPPTFEGSVLIHSGDWTNKGTIPEHQAFAGWIKALQSKFQFIILLNGNHDRVWVNENQKVNVPTVAQLNQLILGGCKVLEPKTPDEDVLETHPQGGCIILHDRRLIIGGVKFYGTPWGICGPAFCLWNQDDQRAALFSQIPADTHVLVTHNPPWLIADVAWVRHKTEPGPCKFCHQEHPNYEHWGDWQMLEAMRRVKPPVFCCGHVHDDACLQIEKIAVQHNNPSSTFDCLISNGAMDLAKRCNIIKIERPNPQKQSKQNQQQQAAAAFEQDTPPPVDMKNNDESTLNMMSHVSTSSDFTTTSSEDEKKTSSNLNNKLPEPDVAFNFFLREASVIPGQTLPISSSSSSSSSKNHPYRQYRYVHLSSSSRFGMALDRDWYDKKMELVILWRLRSHPQVNQLWRFDLMNPNPVPLTISSSSSETVLALQTRISCLVPKPDVPKNSLDKKSSSNSANNNNFESGYLRAFFATNNSNVANSESGVKCVSPSRITPEEVSALEPFTRWFAVPVPGSFNQQTGVVEVVLLFSKTQQQQGASWYVLRANDISGNNDNEYNLNDDDEKMMDKDMNKTELEMVKFNGNFKSIQNCDKWIVSF